ncbi:MAG TPA: hypothetical protein DDW52_08535, partial [Planctomycetaceae bacterium]|nr:hypothetical protein [Planctomycetaceae bacterium]
TFAQDPATAGDNLVSRPASQPVETFSVNISSPSDAAIARMRKDLEFIASDALKGRDSGSEGIRMAADFIVNRYNEIGVRTDAFDGSPFQPFEIPGNLAPTGPENNRITFSSGDKRPTLKLGEDFVPLTLGSSEKFSGKLVFAGYGITAPELDYDDYADVPVEGNVVIVVRREPQQMDAGSKFNGTENTTHAFFRAKLGNARTHKAAAVLFVNDRQTAESDAGDILFRVDEAGTAPSAMQVPMLHVKRASIDPIIKEALGKDLAELEAEIDTDAKPRSAVVGAVTVEGQSDIARARVRVRNVIGVIDGVGDLAKEYVVVGAHYDHVGMGGRASFSGGLYEIHNGADDNGSGTVSLLEIARRLKEMNDAAPRRTVLLMSFTAEEKGLLGSERYVSYPRWPLEDTVAMLNLDMVGRLTNNNLELWGTGTGDTFSEMIGRLNEKYRFDLTIKPQGTGPSDHASFNAVGIPVFHFFTKLHGQYHRPSDDVELVNFEGMERIVSMVTDATNEIATSTRRPRYIGSTPRRRAVLGILLGSVNDGVAVSQVNADSPAEGAGMEPGDVIIQLDGKEVKTTQDLRQIMSAKSPGEEITVSVRRGEGDSAKTIDLELRLGTG